MIRARSLLIVCIVCLQMIPRLNAFGDSSVGTASGQFLKMGGGARAAGMGSAYTAVADDVSSLHWNPAGLSMALNKEFSLTHAEYIANTKYDFAGYAHPTKFGTWAVGTSYLSQGALEGRGEDRAKSSDFDASDLAVTAGFGKSDIPTPFMPLSLGLNLKVLRQQIENESAEGFAVDLGMQAKTGMKNLSIGAAVLNIGPKMTFMEEGYSLPLTISGGAAYQVFNSLTLSADMSHQPMDSKSTLSFGAEFTPFRALALRTGYLASLAGKTTSVTSLRKGEKTSFEDFSGFGMGIGLRISRAQLDYSFTPTGELGNTQRLSLSIKF